ncbi:hypothetical protein D9M71_570770 [compost metagenome]
MPSMPLSGVRISWLMLARKAARAWAMSSARLRACSSSWLDRLRLLLLALSSLVRADTMSSSSFRYWVRRFSAVRRCSISVAMLTNCWLATFTSTPISSCSCPCGHSRRVCRGLRGSLPLSAPITVTSGLVSIM